MQVEAIGHGYTHYKTELLRQLTDLFDHAIFFNKDSSVEEIGKWLKSYVIIKEIPDSESIIDRLVELRK